MFTVHYSGRVSVAHIASAATAADAKRSAKRHAGYPLHWTQAARLYWYAQTPTGYTYEIVYDRSGNAAKRSA